MPDYGSYASLLIVERNTSVGNVPMCSASQTAFSTFSDQLLESANSRKIQNIGETTESFARPLQSLIQTSHKVHMSQFAALNETIDTLLPNTKDLGYFFPC